MGWRGGVWGVCEVWARVGLKVPPPPSKGPSTHISSPIRLDIQPRHAGGHRISTSQMLGEGGLGFSGFLGVYSGKRLGLRALR